MIGLEEVDEARERIGSVARTTPLDYSHTFTEMTGAEVYLKMENHQRTGSFKIRGATNRIRTLTETEQEAGVVTASAGNHAQGVALAATRSGVDAKVVMPETAPVAKVKATEGYGGDAILYGSVYDDAEARARQIANNESRTYIPAFNDWQVIAGQGTLGLELIEADVDIDTVIVPIGGGGLIAGVATAIKAHDDSVRVIGVEAAGADSTTRALADGSPTEIDSARTVADGIATKKVGEKPLTVIENKVDEIVRVTDEQMAVAVMHALERSKTLLEGAGAAPLAAVLYDRFGYDTGEVIVPVLSGGNIDINTLSKLLLHGLVETGRYLRIRTTLPDIPGALDELVGIISNTKANIHSVDHDRTSRDIGMERAVVELDLETRGTEHVEELLSVLEEEGYEVKVMM